MKKFLSALVVFCMIISTSLVAFATTTPTVEELQEKIESAGKYVATSAGSYGVANAYNFDRLVRSGADVSAFEKDFINDVKSNLDANSGHLIVPVYDYSTNSTVDTEAVEYYGSVISALDYIGENPENFNGVNLVEIFKTYDPSVAISNPYFYTPVIHTAYMYDDNETLAKAYIDTLIANYYVMGSGMNYWGFSCDNTAHFIEAIEPLADEYTSYLEDAVKVIKTYKLDNGYYTDAVYSKDANSDATGLVLQAYAIALPYTELVAKSDLADTYAMLCNFETSTKGVYDYTSNETANAFATADALMGLGAYLPYVVMDNLPDEPELDEDETIKSNTDETVKKEEKKEIKKSPATGVGAVALAFVVALAGAGVVTTYSKKKED